MPGRVLRIMPILFLLAPAPVHAQPQIDTHSLALAEALATYRGGDLRAALARLETIPDEKLTETVSRFCTRDDVRPPIRLVRMRITAALLTETFATIRRIRSCDASGSVIGERLRALKAGAGSVIDKLRPKDRAAILSSSHRLDMPSSLTGDREALRKALPALEALGNTSLRDAAYAGLALRGADNTRTLLLLFSDSLDTSSILSESRLMAVARRSDAIVYAIGVRETPRLVRGPVFTQNETLTDDRFLNVLARETGGRFFTPSSIDIERTFTRVFEEFNSRYVLGYTPRGVSQPGWHKLDVKLKTRRGDVPARRGDFGS